jgi:hypothetical protein
MWGTPAELLRKDKFRVACKYLNHNHGATCNETKEARA